MSNNKMTEAEEITSLCDDLRAIYSGNYPIGNKKIDASIRVKQFLDKQTSALTEENKALRDEVQGLQNELSRTGNNYNDLVNTKSENALLGHATMEECNNTIVTLQKDIDQMRERCEGMEKIIPNLWSLWESLAYAGEIQIGMNFSIKHSELESQINSLTTQKP